MELVEDIKELCLMKKLVEDEEYAEKKDKTSRGNGKICKKKKNLLTHTRSRRRNTFFSVALTMCLLLTKKKF